MSYRGLEKIKDGVFVLISSGRATILQSNEIVGLIAKSRSLRAVRKRFPARRDVVLETLAAFGFDFGALLDEQFREGKSDVELAALHEVGVKWIASERKRLGYGAAMGRPAPTTTEDEVLAAYETSGNYSAAARRLGLNRATFTKRYKAAIANKARDHE